MFDGIYYIQKMQTKRYFKVFRAFAKDNRYSSSNLSETIHLADEVIFDNLKYFWGLLFKQCTREVAVKHTI